MLKSLDPLLTPDLLRALAQMGLGDVVAVADRNYPTHSCGRRVLEQPAADVPQMLTAILSLLPVDAYKEPAAWQMLAASGVASTIFGAVTTALPDAEGRLVALGGLGRSEFYQQAAQGYITVRTSDSGPYNCFLIAKGVVT